jgi:hypothetical protein
VTMRSGPSRAAGAALTCITTALVAVLAVDPARASQPVYDGFDDSPGQLLNLQSSGTGFSTTWLAAADFSIGSGSLGFGGLLTSGNCVSFSQVTLSSEQALRFLVSSGFGAGGTTRWMSFLIRPDSDPTSHLFSFGTGEMQIGKGGVNDGNFYEIGHGASATVSSVPIVPGTTVFVAVKYEFNADPNLNDTATVYFDPTPGLAAPDVAGLTISNVNFASDIDGVFLNAANGAAFSLDELRTGDGYVDVAPTGVQNWFNLGSGKKGSGSFTPHLTGSGPLSASSANHLDLSSPYLSTTATLVFGLSAINAPFKGGTLVPSPFATFPLATDNLGSSSLPFVFAIGVPAGVSLYFQFWIHDIGASSGLAASNAVKGVTQKAARLVAISGHAADWAAENTVVLAVSSASPEKNRDSKKLGALSMRLASDTDHAAARRFASCDDFEELELHSTAPIDSKGECTGSAPAATPSPTWISC